MLVTDRWCFKGYRSESPYKNPTENGKVVMFLNSSLVRNITETSQI